MFCSNISLLHVAIYLCCFLVSDSAVCEESHNCESCVSAEEACGWCANLSACAMVDDFMVESADGVQINCTTEIINSTDLCASISTLTNGKTNQKLKCKTLRAGLPDEECNEDVWTEKNMHGYEVLVALPILGAILGVISFFIMVVVWLRFCYNPPKRLSRDDSPTTFSTEVNALTPNEAKD